MELIGHGFVQAFQMLISGDPELLRVILLTLRVSGTATLISLLIGVPVGFLLSGKRFFGRRLFISIVITGLGLPPVVAGLTVSILFWRSGPLGNLRLLYTPTAMVIAQALIATPVVAGLTIAGLQQIPPKLKNQLYALGASQWQIFILLLREARFAILAAVMAGFGSVISEVGASMMVGGNILGDTRVLTTATVMEVSKGNFDVAIALSLVLMLFTYGITLILTLIQQRRSPA
ncbi:MAG TPA: tungstate transporter permease [Firmicutes bacterium]|nr:tungstate transporter permease [Bacillota bacterium]